MDNRIKEIDFVGYKTKDQLAFVATDGYEKELTVYICIVSGNMEFTVGFRSDSHSHEQKFDTLASAIETYNNF